MKLCSCISFTYLSSSCIALSQTAMLANNLEILPKGCCTAVSSQCIVLQSINVQADAVNAVYINDFFCSFVAMTASL